MCVFGTGMSGWGACSDGQDVVAAIKENRVWGEIVAELMANTTMEGVQWNLKGKDAHWFFLDETSIRLNTSADKVLDREVKALITELKLAYSQNYNARFMDFTCVM